MPHPNRILAAAAAALALVFLGAGCGGAPTGVPEGGAAKDGAAANEEKKPGLEIFSDASLGFAIDAQGADCGEYWSINPTTHDSPQGAIAWFDVNHGEPATAWFFYAVMPKKAYDEIPADWQGKPNLVEDIGRGLVLTRFTPPEKPSDAPGDCDFAIRKIAVVPKPSPTQVLHESAAFGFRVVAIGASCGDYYSGGAVRKGDGVTAFPVMVPEKGKRTEWFAYRVMTKAALEKIDPKKKPGRPDVVLELNDDRRLTLIPSAKTPPDMPKGCLLQARPMSGE